MAYHTYKTCYITLENGDEPGALHTCGDIVRAKVHLHPRDSESVSVSNLCVNFKCKARTLITTSNGNNRRTHKCSIYLYWLSKEIIGHRGITVNSHQSWDVEFQFPGAVMQHPSQSSFEAYSTFQYQAGHSLPPTWSKDCRGHTQSVQYYIESVTTRQGRLIEHQDKDQLPLLFCPPLEVPDPAPCRMNGMRGTIMRKSRLLDPARRDEHYGFRERTKDFFGSNQDPSATFTVTASAPTVCCVGDTLPINLHISYDRKASTAPEQPQVRLQSLHIRLNENIQYRVSITTLFGRNELYRDSDHKTDLARKFIRGHDTVYEGMSLNDIVPVGLAPSLGPSFATFSISRQYMLKISAVFDCAGKDYDLTIFRRALTVHPARMFSRTLPGPISSPMHLAETQADDTEDGEENLPLYVAGPSRENQGPPLYEEGAAQKLTSS